jgi:hypothetical protein
MLTPKAMDDANDIYAVDFLKSWFQEHRNFFETYKIKSEYKDTNHGSARLTLESTRYMAQVCVWDHASSMDVEILELSTEKCTFPHVGECKTRFEFESELTKFLDWVKNEEQTGV